MDQVKQFFAGLTLISLVFATPLLEAEWVTVVTEQFTQWLRVDCGEEEKQQNLPARLITESSDIGEFLNWHREDFYGELNSPPLWYTDVMINVRAANLSRNDRHDGTGGGYNQSKGKAWVEEWVEDIPPEQRNLPGIRIDSGKSMRGGYYQIKTALVFENLGCRPHQE